MYSALDLVIIVVQANNVYACKLDNLTSGSSNTTSDVQYTHIILKAHLVCEIVLMASNGLVERLAIGIAAEVKALAPTILVQVSGKVVVVPREGSIFLSSLLVGISSVVQDTGTIYRLPCVSPRSPQRRPCCPSA